ncbi:hypothetical protein GCK32_005461 [Trichostrongylus colubriformis]|uniref:Fatty-acid and retinol-binding protein 1 n=1 Tax=Trichostrongylus colubriformis TaxID=6319 RepID=A0AAN8FJA5_TRICO
MPVVCGLICKGALNKSSTYAHSGMGMPVRAIFVSSKVTLTLYGYLSRTTMLVVLSLLIGGVVAQITTTTQNSMNSTNPFVNFNLTVPMVNLMLRSLEMQKEYIPNFLHDPLMNMTEDEKQDMVSFTNRLMRGQIASIPVNNFTQFMQLIQQNAPRFYQKAQQMYTAAMKRVDALNPEAKAFVSKLMDKWAEIVTSMTDGNALQRIFNFYGQLYSEAKRLPSAAVDSLMSQFPEFVKLWHQCPQIQQFADYMANDSSMGKSNMKATNNLDGMVKSASTFLKL